MDDYEWTAPSGVKVISSVPEVEKRWWDNKYLHIIWSWHSWISLIVRQYGFNPRWTHWWKREPYKATYENLRAESSSTVRESNGGRHGR